MSALPPRGLPTPSASIECAFCGLRVGLPCLSVYCSYRCSEKARAKNEAIEVGRLLERGELDISGLTKAERIFSLEAGLHASAATIASLESALAAARRGAARWKAATRTFRRTFYDWLDNGSSVYGVLGMHSKRRNEDGIVVYQSALDAAKHLRAEWETRLAAAEQERDEAVEELETLEAGIDAHLPRYKLGDEDDEANVSERVEYAGDELKRRDARVAAREERDAATRALATLRSVREQAEREDWPMSRVLETTWRVLGEVTAARTTAAALSAPRGSEGTEGEGK